MTLLEVIRKIEDIASAQPSINMIIENDVYKLNGRNDALYGVFAFVQEQHTEVVLGDSIEYGFKLVYIDRLIEDKSNQLEVQSTAIQTLSNIVQMMDEAGLRVEALGYDTFDQRFVDDCSGAMTSVKVSVPKDSLCGEVFEKRNIKII